MESIKNIKKFPHQNFVLYRIWTWLFLPHFEEAETPSYMKESNNAVATVTTVTSSPTRQKVWKHPLENKRAGMNSIALQV